MAIGSRIYCLRKTSGQDVDAPALKKSLNASNRRTISLGQLDRDVRNSMCSQLNSWSMKRTQKAGTQVRVCRRCY